LSKTALIVDDSKSARVVLKRMLETHDLDVDTAVSAEDALIYLSDHRPDVIFMDHLMPGMDGFEAVSAIKNNPATATIPIMMYTSQEGEVYVGQARALGAVGVLPKQVEPVEVSKVLQSLRVIGDSAERRVHKDDAEAGAGSGEFPNLETLDQDLRTLIQDLFVQQRAVLRRDLLDSYETIATRVVDEIRLPDVEVPGEEPMGRDSSVPGRLQVAVGVLSVASLIFAGLYWQRERSWQELQQQNASLQQMYAEQQAFGEDSELQTRQQLNDYQQSLGTARAVTLNTIEWAANQSSAYDIDSLPLDDFRLSVIEELSEHLRAIDFSGLVRIETHVGDFCMSSAGANGYRLTNAELTTLQCDRVGFAPGEAFALGFRQSVAFANFIKLAETNAVGGIRFDIISLGNSDPLLEYPDASSGVSAAVWNEIAAQNNRVEISIYSDGQ
jgi:CheY-like chemotaxis protein